MFDIFCPDYLPIPPWPISWLSLRKCLQPLTDHITGIYQKDLSPTVITIDRRELVADILGPCFPSPFFFLFQQGKWHLSSKPELLDPVAKRGMDQHNILVVNPALPERLTERLFWEDLEIDIELSIKSFFSLFFFHYLSLFI